jgi:hypothetical protein
VTKGAGVLLGIAAGALFVFLFIRRKRALKQLEPVNRRRRYSDRPKKDDTK